jgi:hypothetical protein
MADNKEVVIGVEVKGVEKSIESVKDLKDAIKAAKDEQIKAAQTFGEGSKEYLKASQNVSKLKDKVDDLNDSTKSLKGSGVERASEGFSQLGEGLRNLDLDKVKTGFSALKTAIAAVGIGLLVQLVTYLYENFDRLSKGGGILATILNAVGSVVKDVTQFFTDLIGVTSEATRAIEAQTEALQKNTEAANENLNLRTSSLDRLIAIEKASGRNTTELELQKQRDIIQTTKAIRDSIQAQLMRGGLDDEQQKKLQKQYDENEKRLLSAINTEKVIEITAKKAISDAEKTANDEKAVLRAKNLENKKKADAELLASSDKLFNDELALQEQYRAEDYIAKQKAIQDDLDAKQNALDFENAIIQADNLEKQARTQQKLDAEKLAYETLEAEKFNLAKQGIEGVQQLTDLYFLFKSQKTEKGSKEEAENAKRAFEINKALQLSTATINGIQAVQGAFTTATASPITTVFPAYPFIQSGLAGVFAAANIAKIAASKFNSGGGSASISTPSTPSVSIPSAPTINTQANNTNQSTSFDSEGNKTTNNVFKVNATIGVNEINDKQNRVSVLENQSTF